MSWPGGPWEAAAKQASLPGSGRPSIERWHQRKESGLWGQIDLGFCPHPPEGCLTLGRSHNPLRLSLLHWKVGCSLPHRIVGRATGGNWPCTLCGGWHCAGPPCPGQGAGPSLTRSCRDSPPDLTCPLPHPQVPQSSPCQRHRGLPWRG